MFHYPGVPQLYPFVNNSINKSWYALRITYSRELAFKEYLDSRGVRNFLPMRYEYVFRGERKIRKLVPVVHNLVFVYATRSEVDEMKSTVGASLPIRYIMDRETVSLLPFLKSKCVVLSPLPVITMNRLFIWILQSFP